MPCVSLRCVKVADTIARASRKTFFPITPSPPHETSPSLHRAYPVRRPDVPEQSGDDPRAGAADQYRLLRLALDEHRRANVDRLLRLAVLLDRHRGAVRHFLAVHLEDRLADQLGHEEADRLHRDLVRGIQRWRLGQRVGPAVMRLDERVELEIAAEPGDLDQAKGAVLSLAEQLGLQGSERRSYLELLLTNPKSEAPNPKQARMTK